jgi:diguanylate cyclase (GGDEF)-like protein
MAAAPGQPFGPATVARIAASSLGRVSTYTSSLFLALHATVTGAACLDSMNRPTGLLFSSRRAANRCALPGAADATMKRTIFRRVAALCMGLLLVAVPASLPAAPVEVDAGLSRVALAPHLEVLEDTSGNLSFDAVRQSPDFKPAPAEIGFSHSAWWVRLTLDNTSARDRQLLLRQDYPLIDYIDLWTIDHDGRWHQVRTGDRRAFSTREFEHRDFIFALDAPAASQRTVYLRFATSGQMDISLALYEPHALLAAISNEQLAYGAYYGGFIVLVLYNFFIFLVVRDRAFFYYLLYAISYGLYFSVYNGLSFEYLWPNNPVWGNQSLLVLLPLSLIFGLQFARKFLETGTYSPKVDVFAVVLQVLAAFGLAASFFVSYSTLVEQLALLTIVVTVTILSMGSLGLIKGYRPARYFMIAWSMLLLGVLINMFKTFGLLPHNMLTQNGLQFGSLMEMVLLSLALASRVNEMQRQSRTDALTKLSNRRFFDERVAFEFERAQRNRLPISLLVADIDHFKQFNDRFGHTRGDEVLKTVAKQLLEGVRSRDIVCRYGGEEFALILPGANGAQAVEIAESLRKAIESHGRTDGQITISVGVASDHEQHFANVSDFFRAADDALYQAKNRGRNCVVQSGG